MLFAAAAAARAAAAVAATTAAAAAKAGGGNDGMEEGERDKEQVERLKADFCGNVNVGGSAPSQQQQQQEQQQQQQNLRYHLSAFSDFRQLKSEGLVPPVAQEQFNPRPETTVKKAQQQQHQAQRTLKPRMGTGEH